MSTIKFLTGAAVAAAVISVWPSHEVAAQNAPIGAVVFKQRCSSCHSITAGKAPGIGPSLTGVVGRKAGATSFNYSPAMKKSTIVWTKANLDKYLAGPAKMVPGTKMTVSLSDSKDRAAVIHYLTTTK